MGILYSICWQDRWYIGEYADDGLKYIGFHIGHIFQKGVYRWEAKFAEQLNNNPKDTGWSKMIWQYGKLDDVKDIIKTTLNAANRQLKKPIAPKQTAKDPDLLYNKFIKVLAGSLKIPELKVPETLLIWAAAYQAQNNLWNTHANIGSREQTSGLNRAYVEQTITGDFLRNRAISKFNLSPKIWLTIQVDSLEGTAEELKDIIEKIGMRGYKVSADKKQIAIQLNHNKKIWKLATRKLVQPSTYKYISDALDKYVKEAIDSGDPIDIQLAQGIADEIRTEVKKLIKNKSTYAELEKTVEKAVQKQQSEAMTQTLESIDYFNRLAKILRWFCANCPVWSVFKKTNSNECFHKGVSNMLLKKSYETKDPQQKIEIYQQFIDFYRGK